MVSFCKGNKSDRSSLRASASAFCEIISTSDLYTGNCLLKNWLALNSSACRAGSLNFLSINSMSCAPISVVLNKQNMMNRILVNIIIYLKCFSLRSFLKHQISLSGSFLYLSAQSCNGYWRQPALQLRLQFPVQEIPWLPGPRYRVGGFPLYNT